MNAIEINNLTKKYKKSICAVDDFSLAIPSSSIFGIVGPNGAGKSTVMNILAGVINKTEGSFTILGKQIKKGGYEYKREVGFVLDKPHYIEKLSVIDYLNFCAAMYELPAKEIEMRVSELLHFFELDEKKDERIEFCSKGMKKKVSLAAAMIHQPKLLILDEPLEGIDPVAVKQIKDTLRLMAEKGVTVILSSHNLDAVEKFCDEVAIIDKGKLVFQCKTQKIRAKIKNELTKETYESLEEIFIDAVSTKDTKKGSKKLSWL
ncbi:ABC transporter ATP-binding protein [Fodinibius halophilus]|uniref:ABC transporter ATP-binding protein n=1 Tax=Fodinibius halophilus TaxID=1736908 RepID=A0A6M1TFR0_9BACT|nr:ABC transporter ATP-binding protein [Fodinibius halophilus]NGP89624.1 ABC transporter ATP-binding protein [Fodinibius halophilus]